MDASQAKPPPSLSKVGPIVIAVLAGGMVLAALLVPPVLLSGQAVVDAQEFAAARGPSAGLATGATLLVVVALAWLMMIYRAENALEPYLPLLRRLAEEHGVEPWMDRRRGAGFESAGSGSPIEVFVEPRGRGSMVIRNRVPPRVRFMAMLKSTGMTDHAQWHPVETGREWFLRANDTAGATQLLGEFDFVVVLDDLFKLDYMIGMRHDENGVELVLDLVEPTEVEGALRLGMKAVHAIRRVNAPLV